MCNMVRDREWEGGREEGNERVRGMQQEWEGGNERVRGMQQESGREGILEGSSGRVRESRFGSLDLASQLRSTAKSINRQNQCFSM